MSKQGKGRRTAAERVAAKLGRAELEQDRRAVDANAAATLFLGAPLTQPITQADLDRMEASGAWQRVGDVMWG